LNAAEPFPSLLLRAGEVVARGAFARRLAEYLEPDLGTVAALRARLERHHAAVVAHFYMDAELQGVLWALRSPFVHVSDSLQMADAAVRMVERGARRVAVLGVDFMSENVRAVLDAAGHADVPVYRVASEPIGCSLAEAAETPAYLAWLGRAAARPRALHVVYINTSLRTKARAHHLLPTITCTSSNVLRTVLQAAAQDPELEIWFGPDTHMGRNVRDLLCGLANAPEAVVRALHPAHDPATIRALVERFHHFEQGSCVVHELFGPRVAARVEAEHPDAFVTAHLEVPGEMFAVGVRAQARGRGVVGSTSDILGFVAERVRTALAAETPAHLEFVLGTESGMVTAIVREVGRLLAEGPAGTVEVEIVFPVASDAVASTADPSLPLVPGVAAGEGCSTAGGCATCPFMRMNSLEALEDLLDGIGRRELAGHEPRKYADALDGHSVAELGGIPILHMRELQRSGRLGEALVARIDARARQAGA
jgi:quinolinate synthase